MPRPIPHTEPSKKLIRPRVKRVIRELKKYKLVPEKGRYGDLKALAKKFNVKLVFSGRLEMAGGFARYATRTITIATNTRSGWPITRARARAMFMHELTHFIQYDVNYDIWGPYVLSHNVRQEQEAQSASKELCKIFFPEEKFYKHHFDGYFSKRDIRWLYDYHKQWGCENDLTDWLKGK